MTSGLTGYRPEKSHLIKLTASKATLTGGFVLLRDSMYDSRNSLFF